MTMSRIIFASNMCALLTFSMLFLWCLNDISSSAQTPQKSNPPVAQSEKTVSSEKKETPTPSPEKKVEAKPIPVDQNFQLLVSEQQILSLELEANKEAVKKWMTDHKVPDGWLYNPSSGEWLAPGESPTPALTIPTPSPSPTKK